MADAQFSIPSRIRGAILNMLADEGIRADRLVWELGKQRGFTTTGELLEFISERYGGDVPEQVAERLYQVLQASAPEYELRFLMEGSTLAREIAAPVLISLPDDMFAAAAELGRDDAARQSFDTGHINPRSRAFEATVTELLVTNGIPYHFEEGRLVPSMSPSASVASVQLAVDALDDYRLAVARTHFVEALRRLREPDPDEAVDEARQAVESAMLALLDAHVIPRPEKHQPNDLFAALVPAVMSRDAEELVLATPRFRGRTRAGHDGRPAVTLDEAQAAVASAAASLLYLAGKLP